MSDKEELEKIINGWAEYIPSLIYAETSAILLAMNLYMKRTFGKKFYGSWDSIDKIVQKYREDMYKEINKKYLEKSDSSPEDFGKD